MTYISTSKFFLPPAGLTSQFNLPKYLQNKCDRYYILHWRTEYFGELFYKQSGRISHQDVTYQIVFCDPIPVILKSSQVRISFRRLKGQSNGFALVRVSSSVTKPGFLPLNPKSKLIDSTEN